MSVHDQLPTAVAPQTVRQAWRGRVGSMAAAVLFPPRYLLGYDDDAPASSSRFRARLNPWRPAPLFIPDADEKDPAERTNASGSCTDELQSVDG